jgi:hypothetical protein
MYTLLVLTKAVHRSMATLRFPEVLLFPCVRAVQTLLMVGMYYQNSGSADASWSLLGLTYRLAQSLGLPKKDGELQYLWYVVVESTWGLTVASSDTLQEIRLVARLHAVLPIRPLSVPLQGRINGQHNAAYPSKLVH